MITQIRPSQLTAWIESVKEFGPAVVLDVREPYEVKMAHIEANGFELVCIPMGVIPPRLHELKPNQPIACMCHHGGRSMQVAYFLAQRGFTHVANIAGGINAWSAEVDRQVPRY
jgi:rhodanese-related sulfurtransferase